MNITRLFDFPYHQLKTKPIQNALVTKKNGKWEETSSQEFIDKANQISRGLLRLGVKPNDKIAIISATNRTEWNIMDIGLLQIGAQSVPIYPTISAKEYAYIFNHAETNLCFVSDAGILEKVNAVREDAKTLQAVYSFDEIDTCDNWTKVLALGEDTSNQDEVEARKNAVNAMDLATIIYTSGTTGVPKGVMLSHDNIVSNVLASIPRLPLIHGSSRVISFLPVCHIFERMLHYLYISQSVAIYFAEGIDKIGDNIREVNPNLMSVVPRLLEKIHDGIIAKGTELTGIKKRLFFWAVELGYDWKPYGENGWWYEKKLALARKLIFSKWQAALGGQLDAMVSGSAALQPRLTKIFCAAGMQVMEGYGLTETSPVATVNMYKDNMFRIGTVGKAIDRVEIKIADDDEILIKGPNVMMGYYKNPELTAKVMKNGYFHTGDKGAVDSDGFLRITGRKKEIFKTSGGKYISPVLLENEMKQSRFIEQIMVVGEGEKMPAAIVQPAFDFVRAWAKRHDIAVSDDNAELIVIPEVKKRIEKEIKEKNQGFGKWEQIKVIQLTPDVWGVDNGLLTPTFKPKRAQIKEKYIALYNKIYNK
jgi:long-chain acyl-CoA synthetase